MPRFYTRFCYLCKNISLYGKEPIRKLHSSQDEVERNDEYSIFTYYLRPEFDFIIELLSNGEDVEVLEPIWLRKEVGGIIKRMWNKYKNDIE